MFRRKKDRFAVHLSDIASNLMESAKFFNDYKLTNSNDLKVFSSKMKEYETNGDTLVHQVIHDLNTVFITPIEREDILSLAQNMDDILDGLEHTAALLEIYAMSQADEYMHRFVALIHDSVVEIEKSIELIFSKRLPEVTSHAIQIKEYETKCDQIWRESIKNLFLVETDPIQIIQYKEIYEELEEVADYCENVANTFEAIIMKNA